MTILQLIVEKNGKHISTEEYSADCIVSIGRGDDNVLVLESSNVSRNHCQLIFENGNWQIEDLGSTNGVELDGVKVTKEVVNNRSSLAVRPFLLTVSLPSVEADGTIADSTLTGDGTFVENATHTDLTAMGGEEEQTMVGTSVGEDGTYIQDEIQQNFILVQNGLSSGVSVPLFEENIIGSQSSCDLVLRDVGIESEHLRISYDGKRYSFIKLSASEQVLLNGKNAEKGFLKDADSLLLGEVELRLRIGSSAKGVGIAGFVKDNLKVVLLVVLLVMMGMAFITLLGDDSEPQNNAPVVVTPSVAPPSVPPVPGPQERKEEGVALSLEQKRQYARLMYKAKQFMEAGEYKKAANRLDAALGIDEQGSEAEELFQQCQAKILEVQKEATERARLINEYTSETQEKISQVENYIQSGDLMSALGVVKELNARKNEFPELIDIHARIKGLERRIEQDKLNYQKKRTKKKESFEHQLAQVKSSFDLGVAAYDSGQFREARIQWEAVVASNLGVPERKQAAAYLKKMKKMLGEQNRLNSEKAAAAMRKKDYPTALYYFHRVLAIDPDDLDVKPQYDKILFIQIKEAQHSYQKGLVYEGINNIDQAANDWRKVLKVLPVEESEYYIKAKRKLAEYGLQ